MTMIAIVQREARLLARIRGLHAAAAVHACLLATFVMVWSSARVPMLAGADVYEQQRTVQWFFAALATPWIVARAAGAERRDAWAWLSLVAGTAPSRLIAGRLAAVAAFLGIALAAAWPAVLLAQQMAGVAFTRALADQMRLGVFVAAAATLSLHFVAWTSSAIGRWLSATTATLVWLWVQQSLVTGGAASLVAAAVFVTATVLLWYRADRTLCCLAEERA